MKIKLLLVAVFAVMAFAIPASASATVSCLTQTSGPYAGQCLHWPDGVRVTAPASGAQTNIPVRVFGDYNVAFGQDNTTFRNSWGFSGCGAGGGNFNVVCGELLNLDPVVNTASYQTGACPIGSPNAANAAQPRGLDICISDVPQNAGSAWNCFNAPSDTWVGCNTVYWFYIWQNNQWTPSNHIANALSWIDRTAFLLSSPGVPNYSWPYWYKMQTKQQVGCHEAMGHAMGAGHAPQNSSCLQGIISDHQNPQAADNSATPFLYGAATDITAWHNHNDAFGTCTSWNPPQPCPNYGLAATAKSSLRVPVIATQPWKFYGKKGVKVVVGKPFGPPRPGYIYLGASQPEALLSTLGHS